MSKSYIEIITNYLLLYKNVDILRPYAIRAIQMTTSKTKLNIDNESDTLKKISASINAIQNNTGFGSIEIVIHDGKIVQIEQREKIRFSNTNLNKK